VDSSRLAGRRIAVTGASSGIGRAIAAAALRSGASVAGLARRTHLLAEVSGLVPVACDITDNGAAGEAVRAAVGELGGLDVLVNAAGINRPGLIEDTEPEDWRAVFGTNVLGLLAVTQAAIPSLRVGMEPTVVNISSNSGHRVLSPVNGVYAASKAAVVMLSDAMRKELGPEVRVMDIAPGYVRDTEIHAGYTDPEHRREADERQQSSGMELDHFADLVVGLIAQPGDVAVQSLLVTKTGYEPQPYRS